MLCSSHYYGQFNNNDRPNKTIILFGNYGIIKKHKNFVKKDVFRDMNGRWYFWF
jgi:hypothetical protein